MRRIAAAAGMVAALVLSACGLTDNTDHKDNRPSSSPAPAPSTAVGYRIAPVTRTSTFHVAVTPGSNQPAYDVTFKRGSLTSYRPNLSAATTPPSAKHGMGNNLGMPLNTGCKSMKAGEIAYPFSISVTGTTKGANDEAIVKITAFTDIGGGVKAAAPKGSIKMEFMQSNAKPRCYDLNEGAAPKHYMIFGSTLYKTTQTMNGWIILDASKVDGYKLAVTSHPAYTYAMKTSKFSGEFTGYTEKVPPHGYFVTDGGTVPLMPGGLG